MASANAAGWFGRFGAARARLWIGAIWLLNIPLWYIALAVPAPSDPAVGAMCDRAAAALLDSRDPVELQRADILIRHLDCGVRRRLPREP